MKLVRAAVAIGVLADEDVVVRLFAGFDLRIANGAGDPEAAALVPAHLDRFHDAVCLTGEKIHLKAVCDLEGSEFLLRRERLRARRLDGDGRAHADGRHRLAGDGGLDVVLGLFQQREEILHLLRKDALRGVLPILGVRLRGAVAIEEGPVHGAPVVEPEALEFEDLGADRLVGDGSEAEGCHHMLCKCAMACFGELEAIFSQRISDGSDLSDKRQTQTLREFSNLLRVSLQRSVLRGHFSFKRCRGYEQHAPWR